MNIPPGSSPALCSVHYVRCCRRQPPRELGRAAPRPARFRLWAGEGAAPSGLVRWAAGGGGGGGHREEEQLGLGRGNEGMGLPLKLILSGLGRKRLTHIVVKKKIKGDTQCEEENSEERLWAQGGCRDAPPVAAHELRGKKVQAGYRGHGTGTLRKHPSTHLLQELEENKVPMTSFGPADGWGSPRLPHSHRIPKARLTLPYPWTHLLSSFYFWVHSIFNIYLL